jgi:hypothetical protein
MVINLTRRTRWREGVDDNVLVPPEKLIGAPLALGRARSLMESSMQHSRVQRMMS